MKTELTKRLLGFLIKKGYKYCLSKTFFLNQHDTTIGIILKPVKKHPLLQKLPYPYDTYLGITAEVLQMASGTLHTKIFVELNGTDFKRYDIALHA